MIQEVKSCLILVEIENTPVHIVVAPHEEELIIITLYIPESDKWDLSFTRRNIK